MSIDWSNPTLQGVLIAGLIGLAGVVIAAVAGYFGAKAGARIGAEAATESARFAQADAQAAREDARQAREADRADARATRFADRKLQLAVDLLVAADVHSDECRVQVAAQTDRWNQEREFGPDPDPGPLPEIGTTQSVRAGYQALDLVAPGISGPGLGLYRATVALGALATRSSPVEWGGQPRWDNEWLGAVERWDDARHDFVDAVRADLGVNPDNTW